MRTVSDGQDRVKPIRAAPNSGLVTQERLTYQHCGICSKAVSGNIEKRLIFSVNSTFDTFLLSLEYL